LLHARRAVLHHRRWWLSGRTQSRHAPAGVPVAAYVIDGGEEHGLDVGLASDVPVDLGCAPQVLGGDGVRDFGSAGFRGRLWRDGLRLTGHFLARDVFGLRRWYTITLVMGTFFVLGQAYEY